MPPEFFLDRNLGRRVSEELRARGWVVHRIGDVYADDGQDVPDEEWISLGLRRGWVPLSKDGRIRGRDRECGPLREHAGILFYLDNQQLRSTVIIDRFDSCRPLILEALEKGGPAAYAVRADGIEQTWP
ncbi:toxin-antitoxin system, toxin component, PIN family protein [Streptomyces alkaliphilus]|uniref:Toxin-antitoxin system, toxin component, PIN family protein n=1 Tax=Streptomyces alkaliphilus TaxID=1472722 RepID=A0A7W3TAB0_9ACTN|nr:toxin-antitoxin system, toxin component, PIN family protein [Streptomyces alkaliphilus]